MRIAIAADHSGVAHKARLVDWLRAGGHEVTDIGTDDEAVVDYPALCVDVCTRIGSTADLGIVLGDGGGGELIACNWLRTPVGGGVHAIRSEQVNQLEQPGA